MVLSFTPPSPPINRPAVLVAFYFSFFLFVSHRRGLNPPHRVKSISMTTFTEPEVVFLQSRGNEVSHPRRKGSRLQLPYLSVELCLKSIEKPYSFLFCSSFSYFLVRKVS